VRIVMRWPRPYPTRGDVMGILFTVVLLGLIFLIVCDAHHVVAAT
jgi:hypothetical protein